jgi:prepilin-type N-terminal cleavage/methylation domain-containing protein
MKPLNHTKKNQRGFSLIELMIVIAIIGILIGVGIAGYRSAIKAALLQRSPAQFVRHFRGDA